jgi:tetraacyldisaccharide 4'-kinase
VTALGTGALHVRVAAALESGAFDGALARGLGRVWAERAQVARPVDLPKDAAVIGVGGSTLGGSYKTPLVLALARGLALRGEPVSVVASSYGARFGRPRRVSRVSPEDSVADVGDEALWLARALAPLNVPVVAGGDRSAAIHLAASLAPRVLVDALLQARPVPLSLSILSVDEQRPWGAGRCPPAGDLRAPEAALRGAADVIVFAQSTLTHADPASGSGVALELAALRDDRVGLVTAIARPDRILRSLALAGLRPAFVRRFADHGTPRPSSRSERRAAALLWLTTPKCATKMGDSFERAPVFVLRHTLALPDTLLDSVVACRPH